jgi:hypothetical protein
MHKMKRKQNAFLVLKGGFLGLEQRSNSLETANESKEKMSSNSNGNDANSKFLTSLQNELQKIEIKPKYIKINLKK